MDLSAQKLYEGLTYYVVLLFSLSFHESAHAWMAQKLGDDTAAREGRISMNPVVHIDPVGTVVMPMLQILFGSIPLLSWAKPTPYNPGNFDRQHSVRKGHVLVAGAGPVSNMILCLAFLAALFAVHRSGAELTQQHPVFRILVVGVLLNVALAVFNLLPLPPLDGSKVASFGLPGDLGERYDRMLEPVAPFLLLILVMTGILGRIVQPIIRFVSNLLFSIL